MKMEGRFISYLRVSTARQGQSGLGLEAQREAVHRYLNGGHWELLQEFLEVETGKGSDALNKRPVLRAAITYAKKHKATLIIAKLDRLARNVHFVSGLMETKVPFVCADMPEANNLTLHVMAAFAEYEAKRISQRTKEGLAAAKARGVKLGNPNIKTINRQRVSTADDFAEKLRGTIQAYRSSGMTQRAIVEALNNLGVKTPRDGKWGLRQVQLLMARLGIK